MAKTSQDIIGKWCIRNDDGVLAITYEDNLKSYNETFFNRVCMR